jgi:hypothetical protein
VLPAAAVPLVFGAVLLGELNVLAAGPASKAEPPRYSIRWIPLGPDSNKVNIEVAGIPSATLQELDGTNRSLAQWQRLLSVYADQGDLLANVGLPAMIGEYRIAPDTLRFEPQFPLQRGIHYRAVFSPNRLPGKLAGGPIVTSTFHLPDRPSAPTTVVANVFPTADVLPENLLKFYIHFSAPMSAGHIYDHIRLRNEAGKEIELPFLEIDEELWNPTMTRLTLFIDPGRIKRGVQPLEEIGPALEEGKRYTLVIDAGWRDAANIPLKEGFQKRFMVGPTDREPIDLSRWKIQSPPAESRRPLLITFSEPMDHALALRVIRVLDASNQLIAGSADLTNQERHWSFTPVHPWHRGPHHLSVQTTIEDLAGNNVGKAFDVDLFDGVQRRFTNSTVSLPFTVR